jgi:hypothetical protein
MTGGGSIIKFDDLGKPATELIDKIAAAVEGIYKPTQIKRIAKAQAEADIIKAKSEIEIHELQQRALQRFVAEEAKKQENMEKITEQALPLLNKDSDPQKMEDDWITNFFDKCRIISDSEMQVLWAKLLAGEANLPGKFSKRTVNLLSSLDKTDAQLFTRLCGFRWMLTKDTVLIYNEHDAIYNQQGINFETLNHLANIGLITTQFVGYRLTGVSKKGVVNYFNKFVLIQFKKEDNNELNIGRALLSKAGEQLTNICNTVPVEGFFEYIVKKWEKDGLEVSILSNKKE